MSPDDPSFLLRLDAIEKEPIWLDVDGVVELVRAARMLHVERDAAKAERDAAIASMEAMKAEGPMLRESLRRLIRHLEVEGYNGDGIADSAWDDYRAARGLVHGDTGECVERGMAALREHGRSDP